MFRDKLIKKRYKLRRDRDRKRNMFRDKFLRAGTSLEGTGTGSETYSETSGS
jgi:hypothetical protein